MSVITEDDVLWLKPGWTCDSAAKGYMKKNLVLKWREWKHWNQIQNNTARNSVIRHTITNTSKQQHCSGRNSSKRATQSSDRNTCQVHTNTYSCVIPQCTVYLWSIRSRHPVVKPHRMLEKRCKKRYTPNQRRSSTPGIKPPTSFSQSKNYLLATRCITWMYVRTICICPHE